MRYEIWDVATGNCVGRYETDQQVIARVASLLVRIGDSYADDLELTEEDETGALTRKWTGAALVARSQDALAIR